MKEQDSTGFNLSQQLRIIQSFEKDKSYKAILESSDNDISDTYQSKGLWSDAFYDVCGDMYTRQQAILTITTINQLLSSAIDSDVKPEWIFGTIIDQLIKQFINQTISESDSLKALIYSLYSSHITNNEVFAKQNINDCVDLFFKFKI